MQDNSQVFWKTNTQTTPTPKSTKENQKKLHHSPVFLPKQKGLSDEPLYSLLVHQFKLPVHVGLLCFFPGPEICKSFHHCGSSPPAPSLFWVVHTAVVVTEMKNNTIERVNNCSPQSPLRTKDFDASNISARV